MKHHERTEGVFKSAPEQAAPKPNGKAHDDWPEPEPLGENLPPVATFDLDLLPESLRGVVDDVSDLTQTPPDLAAATTVCGLAGCVNRRAKIQPKVEDYTWQVTPNVWGAAIAVPGKLKTPVMQQILGPLHAIEAEWNQYRANQEKKYAAEHRMWKLGHNVWESTCKKNIKDDIATPLEPEEPIAPIKRRLIAMDATPESLHEILADNPTGVFVPRDELVGLLAEMTKVGREDLRAYYLSLWNGSGAHTVDRIGRGSIVVPNMCASLFGLIQPGRIRPYLEQVAAGGAEDDGFIPRLQVLVWPDETRAFEIVDRRPNQTARDTLSKVFSRLANLPTDFLTMRFHPAAQEHFFNWLRKLENKLHEETEINPAVVSHLSKYRKLYPALAGLFELADYAASGEGFSDGQKIEISLEHGVRAAALCKYLESHARRLYSQLPGVELLAARLLSRHIQRGDLETPFTARSIYRRNWASLKSAEDLLPALLILEEHGWLRRNKVITNGRPAETWTISEKVPRR